MDVRPTVTLRTGRKMPAIGLGTWQLTKDTAETVKTALELGYRMIDTSGDYGTQPGVGEGARKSGLNRGDMFIVTKVEEDDYAYQAARHNIGEIDLKYADLILIHRYPGSTEASRSLWEGLMRARDEGLTKDIGVSNYSISQIQELIGFSGEIPVVNQIEWTPFGHSQEMLEFCQSHGITIQAYSPLARKEKLDDATIQDFAKMYQKTPAQIILRWDFQLGVVPLPKANSPEHLQENLSIFDFEISADDMATLNGLNEQYSSLSGLIYL